MSAEEISPHTARRIAWQTEHDANARAALSKKARREINARFDEIARRHGYEAIEAGWCKTGGLMRRSFGVQPSRYGFECFVNLSASSRPFLGTLLGAGIKNHMRLGWFYDHSPPGEGEIGALCYPDVLAQGAAFERACQVLDLRALPFLERLNGRKKADRAAYLAQCPPFPPAP